MKYLATFIAAPIALCIALDIPPPRLIGWQCSDTILPIVLLREEDEAPGMCAAVLPLTYHWSK